MIQPVPAPLAGLRVVEVSSYVASPLCGMTLAQLGADVIRVERLGGGPDRARWPLSPERTSLYWTGLNKGKRGLAVDLANPAGRQLVADLVVGGDGILVINTEQYAELSAEALRRRREDMIRVSLRGRADGSNAVDYTAQASSGFPLVTGAAGTARPTNGVVPAWDIAAGLYLATAVLAAERDRRLTGRGRDVVVALEDVAVAMAGNLGYLAEAQVTATRTAKDDNWVRGTFGRDFTTQDGRAFMLIALTRGQWRGLVEATGLGDVVAALAAGFDVDFDDEGERYRHREVLGSLLSEVFGALDSTGVEVLLGRTRVLWAWYQSFGEVVDRARSARADEGLLRPLHQPGVGDHLAPGAPLLVDGKRPGPAPAPAVGQHSAEVLRDVLGLGPAELKRLRQDRVIGAPSSVCEEQPA
jgi:2-methylfumaryl-CoA isomerase